MCLTTKSFTQNLGLFDGCGSQKAQIGYGLGKFP